MQENTKRSGNAAWGRKEDGTGRSGNPNGAPKTINKEKRTNKELRNEAFMKLVRKFQPHVAKSINAAVSVIDNKEGSENGKLKAAALIITTYRDLLKETYDYRYDDDQGEEIQQENKPVFSLTMLKNDKEV